MREKVFFNPSQKSPGFSLWDKWHCVFSARDESPDFSPGRFNLRKGFLSLEYACLILVVVASVAGLSVYTKRLLCSSYRQAADSFGHGRQYKYAGDELFSPSQPYTLPPPEIPPSTPQEPEEIAIGNGYWVYEKADGSGWRIIYISYRDYFLMVKGDWKVNEFNKEFGYLGKFILKEEVKQNSDNSGYNSDMPAGTYYSWNYYFKVLHPEIKNPWLGK